MTAVSSIVSSTSTENFFMLPPSTGVVGIMFYVLFHSVRRLSLRCLLTRISRDAISGRNLL